MNTEKQDYFIITGTTRGIGEALAQQLLSDNNALFCISRNANPTLGAEAFIKKFRLAEIAVDLAQTEKLREVMRQVFRMIEPEAVRSISLINNAGIASPIRAIGSGDAMEAIIRSLNVNLEAAMIISDIFIRETQTWNVEKRILNLSTGAAKRPISGWSAYCVSKAGLDMFSRCIAEEQAGQVHPVKVVSFAPGVVNTEMQAEIRESDPSVFPEHGRFVDLKASGQLLEPKQVAETIIRLLNHPDYGKELFQDIRTLQL